MKPKDLYTVFCIFYHDSSLIKSVTGDSLYKLLYTFLPNHSWYFKQTLVPEYAP